MQNIEERKDIQELIKKGKQQGHVTADQVLAVIPRPEQEMDQLEALYTRLSQDGIPIIVGSEESAGKWQVPELDTKEWEEGPTKLEGEPEGELASMAELEAAEGIDDPVHTYLRE